MSSRPKPEVLPDGRNVEFDRCPRVGWSGTISGKATRPGHYDGDQFWMTIDSYPTVRALRAALKDGTARFESMAERTERMGWSVDGQQLAST
jgi:hypothetical protein